MLARTTALRKCCATGGQGLRGFATTNSALSHVGSAPIFLAPEVKIETNDYLMPKVIPKGKNTIRLNRLLTVTGPKGMVDVELPEFVTISKDEHERLNVMVSNPTKRIQRSLWGTIRSLVNNGIVGVTEGHMSVLRFKGTGYRVMLEKDKDGVEWVKMKIGKCDLQGLPIPEGIKCSVPTTTLLVLEGCDKQKLNLFAGQLRNMHPPEPYKGKGIYLNGETVKLKQKKVK